MLEETRADPQTFDKEQAKVMLRFPANFNASLDDLLAGMQRDYAGLMEQQRKWAADQCGRLVRDVGLMEEDLRRVACKNEALVASLSPGLMAAFVMNADDLVELMVADLLDEMVGGGDQVEYLNSMDQVKNHQAELTAYTLHKNRLRQRMAANEALDVWRVVERLEEYKDSDLCED